MKSYVIGRFANMKSYVIWRFALGYCVAFWASIVFVMWMVM